MLGREKRLKKRENRIAGLAKAEEERQRRKSDASAVRDEQIVILTEPAFVDQIRNSFRRNVIISDIAGDPGKVRVAVDASPADIKRWAMQYVDSAEVISPLSLRETIRDELEKGLKKYQQRAQ
ncbi:MAG: WYL domain-containing protein [Mogibacterium sp.]|nr:WYL domain-containing protein [Mogibacterium sp.]